MYSNVVMGMNSSLLEIHLEDYKTKNNIKLDKEMKEKDWETMVSEFKDMILQDTGKSFPQEPWQQLWLAIQAVFLSWKNPRAMVYRKSQSQQINAYMGTAVNVQSMVFGNLGKDSATGVVFTRNPSTGEDQLFGEFLINAQGEDIVAGTKTPMPILSLKTKMPKLFNTLLNLSKKLERHYKYAQDIEWTIENNKLWILQTRNALCSCKAQIKIAFDLKKQGVLDECSIIKLIQPSGLKQLLHPFIDKSAGNEVLTKGLPASPGAGSGQVVFNTQQALEVSKKGDPVILVRAETSPEDINGMLCSKGILTVKGGMTSHAAVVARSMGKPCIVGCHQINVNEQEETLQIHDKIIKKGDFISIDGATGKVFKGKIKTTPPELEKNFFNLMQLTNKYSTLNVRANADTPEQAKKALEFGANGIGLCRTEHMFFAKNRINIIRQMIMAEDKEERLDLLSPLFDMQKQDFYEILKIMDSLPVTIRFLDPPLHEFLPQTQNELQKLAKLFHINQTKLLQKVEYLKETNPMLGHRGCRLAITYPEIYLMQARAVAMATIQLLKEGKNPKPEIMLPFVCIAKELEVLRKKIENEIKKISQTSIPIGTMIELPSACLEADKIVEHADFLSFGTNDLSQTTLGISRDDAGKFLPSYVNQEFFTKNPFSQIEINSVGELIKIAIEKAMAIKPNIKTGICGEQGGDAFSISFFHKIGLSYVSCSPYRVPEAKLATAQSYLEQQERENAH